MISNLNKSTFPGIALPLSDSQVTSTTGSPTTATYTSGGISYKTYRFTGSGSITFSKAGLLDILLIGGGAGSGGYGTNCGGGGAGAFIQRTIYLDAGTCNIVVGAGGGTPVIWERPGFPGNPTAIGTGTNNWTYISIGGGGGGSEISAQEFGRQGWDGASGGGSVGGNNRAGGQPVLAGLGNAGGAGAGTQNAAGGGGGFTSAGSPQSGTTSGNGGNGITSTFVDGSTSVAYAGGGGGVGTGAAGSNGIGGGGAANTGGGGRNGSGGSGLVVFRVRA